MGGAAFQSLLGKTSFPRLPPAVYSAVKARLLPRLSELYSLVVVPAEAPEKKDYGDIDFLVAIPNVPRRLRREESACSNGSLSLGSTTVTEGAGNTLPAADDDAIETRSPVPHALVQAALGAKHVIPVDGNRTSHYAVPVEVGEWEALGYSSEEIEFRSSAQNSEIFYQVDIHVCNDEDEWKRIKFFHSYGDMGMMLGLIARNIGLRLGEHGLKFPIPNHPPILLSSCFDEIMTFLGLDKETYDAGFQSKQDIFHWVASIRYFDPRFFRSSGAGITKVKAERTMYREFTTWVHDNQRTADRRPPSQIQARKFDPAGLGDDNTSVSPAIDGRNHRASSHGPSTPTGAVLDAKGSKEEAEEHDDTKLKAPDREVALSQAQKEALIYFDKANEYKAILVARRNRERVRRVFCSDNVREWTELGTHWQGVKRIMDVMRSRMGGESGLLEFLHSCDKLDSDMSGSGCGDAVAMEKLREMAVETRDRLGILKDQEFSQGEGKEECVEGPKL